MRRLFTIIMLFVALTAAQAAAPKWEEVNTPPVELTSESSDAESTVHVAVKDGYVYIHTNEQVTVKIFTILGQLISSEKVPAGAHRLKINARGIYILKLGGITRRITI
ncbi:MAG: T9SS type A sorting domain-containing protein [Duncaniella sp.]|nr:T9SS type A sorting domain-containing protein [Duncaniella sp.]